MRVTQVCDCRPCARALLPTLFEAFSDGSDLSRVSGWIEWQVGAELRNSDKPSEERRRKSEEASGEIFGMENLRM